MLGSSFHVNAEQVDRNEIIKTFTMGLDAYNRGDYASALKYWTPLANQHRPAAQTMLGVMYALGHGVPKDEHKAFAMISEPASQGYALAQYHLAVMYMHGDGIQKNEQEAVVLFRKAAEQGFAEAQNALGVCYEQGRGVTKNIDEARKWFGLASKQGHSGAAKKNERLKVAIENSSESLYRSCVAADLLGTWELRDLRIPNNVSSKDVVLSHPDFWKYQRWIFSDNGKVTSVTSKTPFNSMTEKVAELYNTPVTYTINDQGILTFHNMPDISGPYYLGCQYVLRDSQYGDRKGELVLSSWKIDKTPLWIKYLRKIK